MGGIGYITASNAAMARNNTLIIAHMLEAPRQHDVKLFLFSSSAWVYAQSKQRNSEPAPLKEDDAYPADPEAGYGWESFMLKNSASTTGRITGSILPSWAFIMSTGLLSIIRGEEKKRPRLFVEKSPWR